MRIHGPADNTPREQVQDGREVGPALSGPDVGDVSHPDLVGRADAVKFRLSSFAATGCECRESVVTRKRRFRWPSRPSSRIRRATRLRPTCWPTALQILVDARTPVGLAARSVCRSNLDFERGIFLRPETQATPAPGVETRGRDQERPAQHSHGVSRLLRLDEPELHWLSFAKKAAAFFSISRSIRSCRASRRSATSSARSAVVSAPVRLRPHRSPPASPNAEPPTPSDPDHARPRRP